MSAAPDQAQTGDPTTADPRTEPPLAPSGAQPLGKGVVALRQAALAALMTFVLTFPLVGLQTIDINGGSGLGINLRLDWVLIITAIVFALRLATSFTHVVPRPRFKMRTEAGAFVSRLSWPLGILGLVVAVAIPFLPFSDGYTINIATRILMYAVLGWGLNIVVGLAGLLDLGYVAFYAVGAYTVSILTSSYDFGFWTSLPLAGLLAALFGILLGFPVLRLRGDYLAIVTLGFGEIIRIVILNLGPLTGGPNGISSIPPPTFFGYPFARSAPEGVTTFHQLFGLDYDPLTRPTFIYFCVLVLAVLINAFSLRIRKLPVGRAWEALREDEIACRALGINPTNIKLSAFALGAMIGGLAGAFFPAANQNFVSPESFTFAESAAILAIVVLGGMGSQLGVVLAAILLNVLQELRQFAEFRMLIFGAAMVVIMVWRPRGLLAFRMPSIRLHGARGAKGPPVPAET